MKATKLRGLSSLLGAGVETLIFVAAIVFLISSDLRALLTWEALTALYLIVGVVVVWPGRPKRRIARAHIRAVARWQWVPPLMSSAVGANAAIMALVLRGQDDRSGERTILMIAAVVGIVFSWMLLQIAFADIYAVLDVVDRDRTGLDFPEDRPRSTLDYLYQSFTLGASFATSDVGVTTTRMRRATLIHSVISFFYNALVVAVAFQVIQGLVS